LFVRSFIRRDAQIGRLYIILQIGRRYIII